MIFCRFWQEAMGFHKMKFIRGVIYKMQPLQRQLPKNYSSPIWRAIMEFDMLQPNDRVMVGLSGGKDSSLLLYALWAIQQHSLIPFELAAVTIDPGFSETSPQPALQELCDAMGIPFFFEALPQMKEVIFTGDKRQSPCARCAFFAEGRSIGSLLQMDIISWLWDTTM